MALKTTKTQMDSIKANDQITEIESPALLSENLIDYCRLTAHTSDADSRANKMLLSEMYSILHTLLADDEIKKYLYSFTGSPNKELDKKIKDQLSKYTPELVQSSQFEYSQLVNPNDKSLLELEKALRLKEEQKQRTHKELLDLLQIKLPVELAPYKETFDHFVTYINKFVELIPANESFASQWDSADITTWGLGENEILKEFKPYRQKFKAYGQQFFTFDTVKLILTKIKQYKEVNTQSQKDAIQQVSKQKEAFMDPEIVSKCDFYKERFATHCHAYICPTQSGKEISFSTKDKSYIAARVSHCGTLGADNMFFHSFLEESLLCAYYEQSLREIDPNYHVMHTSLLDDLSKVDAFADKTLKDGTVLRILIDFKLRGKEYERSKEKAGHHKMIDSALRLFEPGQKINFDEVTEKYSDLVNYQVRLEEPFSKTFAMAIVRAALETIYELRLTHPWASPTNADGENNVDYLLGYKDRMCNMFKTSTFTTKLDKYYQAGNSLITKHHTVETQATNTKVDAYIKKLASREMIDIYAERVAI